MKKIAKFIGGAYGFWFLIAVGFFVYSCFTLDYAKATNRITAGFFALTWAMIAELRREILKRIDDKNSVD